MTIDVIGLLVIIVLAGLAWYANEQLNKIPTLKQIIAVLIIIVAVLLVLDSLGLYHGLHLQLR